MDGQTSWRSHAGAARALQLVSACATAARLGLAQTATAEQSNAITAIPALFALLALRGAPLSRDAMGGQREMAQQILDGGGHYRRGLTGNQGPLPEDVPWFFDQPPPGTALQTYEEADKGQGRIALRRCDVPSDIGWLQAQHAWPGLQRLVRLTAPRILGTPTTTAVRDSRSDDTAGPGRLLANTRSHWASDNTLHWTLDMRVGDDACRIRQDHAPLALATIRHVALHFLQAAQHGLDHGIGHLASMSPQNNEGLTSIQG
jgi:predicted transposase YbfD/YdcC